MLKIFPSCLFYLLPTIFLILAYEYYLSYFEEIYQRTYFLDLQLMVWLILLDFLS